MTTYIYGLYDPRSPKVMMKVGKSNNPQRRLREHINHPESERLRRWLAELRAAGVEPQVRVLRRVPRNDWERHERRWIRIWREKNSRLLNIMIGGNEPPIEACRAGALALHASLTPKQRIANARKAALALNASLTPEQRIASARKAGRKASLRTQELYGDEWRRKGGSVGGHRTAELHLDLLAAMGRRNAKLYPEWNCTGPHTRWHVNKGIVNPSCVLCTPPTAARKRQKM